MNKCNLIGRLVKDVEQRTTQSGTPVANFTLAVNRKFAKEGEQQADFINIVAWNKTAEFCEKYFKKGQQVAVSGRIQTSTYEKDGVKHYKTDVIAEDVYFADSKKDGATSNDGFYPLNDSDDELPFK